MAWHGYFEYDGNEVINASRVEAYAKSGGLNWFRPIFKNDALGYMLGDGLEYKSPFIDEAPWTDPDTLASYDFYGVYPLDVTGIEDSTRTSTPVESLGEGGIPGRLRHNTKTIVFNALLLARTEEGAHYGMNWLKQALKGNACGSGGLVDSVCGGATLCYLNGPPDMYLPSEISTRTYEVQSLNDGAVWVDDPEECLNAYLRSLRKVVFNNGPTISSRRETTDGAQVWTVTFSAVAGSPYEWSAEHPVLEGLLDDSKRNRGHGVGDEEEDERFGGFRNPWVGKWNVNDDTMPNDFFMDLQGRIHPESECAQKRYQPIYDPLCPSTVPPPEPPSVPLGCWKPPKNWKRRSVSIPRRYVPLWGEVVPKIEIHAHKNRDVRSLRLRFYADPHRQGEDTDNDCEYCGDIVVSYIPRDHTIVIDGSEQAVYAISPGGGRRRAESLVFKTDGTPFDWPVLTCGFGYLMTVDLPQTETAPSVDLSLFARAA